jgi:hypothetical protein
MDTTENTFTKWLQEILDSGWQGEGMYDDRKVVEDAKFAIYQEQKWDALLPRARSLFCAIQYHQARWSFASGKPRIIPPAFITECQEAQFRARGQEAQRPVQSQDFPI